MGDVIRLQDARKKLKRAKADVEAAQNRARFGRSKAERDRIETAERLAKQRLDAAKIDGGDDIA